MQLSGRKTTFHPPLACTLDQRPTRLIDFYAFSSSSLLPQHRLRFSSANTTAHHNGAALVRHHRLACFGLWSMCSLDTFPGTFDPFSKPFSTTTSDNLDTKRRADRAPLRCSCSSDHTSSRPLRTTQDETSIHNNHPELSLSHDKIDIQLTDTPNHQKKSTKDDDD